MHHYEISEKGLTVYPSISSSPNDFDFLLGKWKVSNRRLRNNSWVEFDAEIHLRKTLSGFGNVENYYADIDGVPFEGQAVRLFNPSTKLWTIYWIDTNTLVMDRYPVIGSFDEGLGKFYVEMISEQGKQLMIYQWDKRDPERPIWSQALSTDNGTSWNWNWEMHLTKIK